MISLLLHAMTILALCLVPVLNGCSSRSLQAPLDTFTDISIPPDLTLDRERTFVVESSSGRTGFVTADGPVERYALSSTMARDMRDRGWTLDGQTSGRKIVHLYSRGNRRAVVVISEAGLVSPSTALEIYAMDSVAGGDR